MLQASSSPSALLPPATPIHKRDQGRFMSLDVALILAIDGLANGAIYLLAGLGLVLVFSVTRVIFVPFGDIAAFAALTLAALENGSLPATIGLVAVCTGVALLTEIGSLVRKKEHRRIPRAMLIWGVLPLIPCALTWLALNFHVHDAVLAIAAVTLVVNAG